MKKFVIVLAVIAMAFGMSSCSSTSSPEAAVKKYCKLMKKGDAKEAYKCSYDYAVATKGIPNDELKEFEEELQEYLDNVQEKYDKKIGKKDGIKNIEIVEVETKENKARAKLEVTYGDGDTDKEKLNVKKYEDNWYVEFVIW